ncbi:hypothetical protein [Xanthomonas maliensis]|uniref:hypothetical protein n=1 Tax=Xanthomonas maliensis TaxID=1321368 RepID=UPI001264B7D1|nr:hypothetical protein [Xanthomonas maliensis]KAB7766796.1 hypothetical protein CKY51_12570 [Xanthomonas maliensis]
MTVVPDAPVTPAALSAFLRGVERRGLVLAQLQCGDPAIAERALAAALRVFRSQAGEQPMADWPARFWRLLASTPPLRRTPMPGVWLPPFTVLGRQQTDDRLALLLRIVAGLEEQAASEVLELTVQDYQQALARACPRDAAGHPDAQAWRALAEAAQQELRALSPAQLARLGQLREAAIAGLTTSAAPVPPSSAPRPPSPASPRRTRWQWRAPTRRQWGIGLGVAGLALLVLVASWWWEHRLPTLPPEPVSQAPAGVLHVTDAAPVLVEQLPAVDLDTPAVQGLDARDQAMLADPDLELARSADFYAWYAAGHPVPPDESGAHATPATAESPAAPLETVDDAN